MNFNKVKTVLGFEPKYTIQDGINELVEAIDNHVFDLRDLYLKYSRNEWDSSPLSTKKTILKDYLKREGVFLEAVNLGYENVESEANIINYDYEKDSFSISFSKSGTTIRIIPSGTNTLFDSERNTSVSSLSKCSSIWEE